MIHRFRGMLSAAAWIGALGSSAALAGLTEYQAAVQNESSLVSYYPFDADAGTDVLDVAPTDPHNGTLTGTATFGVGVGQAGQALSMDGAGHANFGQVVDFAFLDGTGTVEAWVRPTYSWIDQDPAGSERIIASCRELDASLGWLDRYSIRQGSDRHNINVYTANSRPYLNVIMEPAGWYHVVVVFDAGNIMRLYVNGALISSPAVTLGPSTDPIPTFEIGSSNSAGLEDFIGQIDEVAIYADALTTQQVSDHFAAMRSPTPAMAGLAQYQSVVQANSSLVGYYTFENDATGVGGIKDALSLHNGTVSGVVTHVDGIAGGSALGLGGQGHVDVGAAPEFRFDDGTGTIEAWFSPGAVDSFESGLGNRSICGYRDNSVNRYALHLNTSLACPGLATTGNPGGVYLLAPGNTVPFTGGAIDNSNWYHLAVVLDNDGTSETQRTSYYLNGRLVTDNAAQVLGNAAATSFQIGAGRPDGGFRWVGRLDEVAMYANPLTATDILTHYRTVALGLTPADYEFELPTAPTPLGVTLALPTGMAAAPAGGVAVTLTYPETVVQVSAGGPIPTGGQVVIPEGQASVNLTVTPVGGGVARLVASAAGMHLAEAVYRVKVMEGDAVVYVDDHFDDNPFSSSDLDLPAVGQNENGVGSGWWVASHFGNGPRTTREQGSVWDVLFDVPGAAGNWRSVGISGRQEDTFPVMTPEGVKIQWVMNNISLTDDRVGINRDGAYPGEGESDFRQELGIISANTPDGYPLNNPLNGLSVWSEQYEMGTHLYGLRETGGLYVNLYYDHSATQGQIKVNGSVRACNSTKGRHSDGDGGTGIVTVATFVLPNVHEVSPTSPLTLTMSANQNGWEIGFVGNTGATFTILNPPSTPAVQVVGLHKLAGGWDGNSLAGAAMTREFANGARLTAFAQNFDIGRGDIGLDRVRVCSNCTLPGDCSDPFSDLDRDGDTDQDDFALFQACFTGVAGGASYDCACADWDRNGTIDAADFGVFVQCALLSGPAVPSAVECDD